MNQREKEEYLREYAILKSKGKPFFPYAVAKDSVMMVFVMAVIITMSIVLGAELGPKADPTTTTYVPRPEWYFFFLFEVLRVIKPPELVPFATIGVPTICMIMLFLLPFIDRGPERRPERRPIATTAGILVIVAMGYLTYMGAVAGSPNSIDMVVAPNLEKGKLVAAQSGCLACHMIGENGNGGPGPHLTDIGDKLEKGAIRRTLENPTAPMPSFRNLPEDKKSALVDFLASLKGGTEAGLARAWRAGTGTLPAESVRAMFDRIAGVYDVMNTVMTAGLHHQWRTRAVDLARVGPGTRALDVATGTGDLAIELASRGGDVVGSDFSAGMLDAGAREGARADVGAGRRAGAPVPRRCLRRGDGGLRRPQLQRPRRSGCPRWCAWSSRAGGW